MREYLEEYLSKKRIELNTLIVVNGSNGPVTISVDSLVFLLETADEEDQEIIRKTFDKMHFKKNIMHYFESMTQAIIL